MYLGSFTNIDTTLRPKHKFLKIKGFIKNVICYLHLPTSVLKKTEIKPRWD